MPLPAARQINSLFYVPERFSRTYSGGLPCRQVGGQERCYVGHDYYRDNVRPWDIEGRTLIELFGDLLDYLDGKARAKGDSEADAEERDER